MEPAQASQRARGRADRIAKRSLPPAQNPCPPSQIGRASQPLAPAQMQAIYHLALRILAEQDIGEVPEVLERQLVRCGP